MYILQRGGKWAGWEKDGDANIIMPIKDFDY